MEKALRRQAGADVIRLDTQEAFAHYALREPQQIDFAAIEQAAEDAIYTITSITLTMEGEIQRSAADAGTLVFVATQTEQSFTVSGDVEFGRSGLMRAEVQDWTGAFPVLHVLAWGEAADLIPEAR